MPVIRGSKLLNHLDRIVESKRPITAEIFLTNFCNQRCKYCRYDHGNGYVSFENFKDYVNRCLELGARGIILTGGGEPTINPDFDLITNWLEKCGIIYGINTNFNVYKTISPHYLKVSLDAWHDAWYEKTRGVGRENYHIVLENIRKYREFQKENKKNGSLGIQCIVQQKCQATLFWEEHKDLDVDYIVFKAVESVEVFYSEEMKDAIIQEVNELRKKDKRIILNFKWDFIGVRFIQCLSSWSVLTIDVEGRVMFCCHKVDEIVGHLFDEDILEKKMKFITDMNICEIPCRLSGSNQLLEMMNQGEHNVFV